MKYQELIILLPCHSLEDFPTHHHGDDAQGLLANWSALWHPALLAAADALPRWYRADDPPEEVAGRLIAVPSVSQAQIPTGFAQRAKGDGACLVRNKLDRAEIVRTALESLDGGDGGIDPELAADFLALGYCYLQIQLLTRQLRYSSNLDETHFKKQTLAAATAAVEHNEPLAREKLAACFDVLAEERYRYYPSDAFVLDLTMLAPTTIGAGLRDALGGPAAVNLLLSGDLLDQIAQREPETLAAIQRALAENRLGLIGGEQTEQRLPLLSHESLLAELRQGLATSERLLGKRPLVYGRQRFGLTPILPQVLRKLGFEAALHVTFEDGTFPAGSQAKIRWEGADGTSIDSFARMPFDASKPETYLGFAVRIGESIDRDHVAAILLAHWPGTVSPWFHDLQRIGRYGSVLGKFVTVEQFFRDTDLPVHQDRYEAHQYKSPYLKQAVIRRQPDPISTSVRDWRQFYEQQAAETFGTLATLVSRADEAAEQRQAESLDAALEKFAASLLRGSGPAQRGCLVANPTSFLRRLNVETTGLRGLPANERPVYAAAESAETPPRQQLVVDVPPLGFAWLAPEQGSAGKAAAKKPARTLVDGLLLHNEFIQALIDPITGTLRALKDYKSRSNRMSQQIAFRLGGSATRAAGETWKEPDSSAGYSVMAADSVEATIATAALGEIVARGRLLNREGKTLAGFRQTYRLWRGSRVLHVEVELDPQTECQSDPWNSYYCARIAWASPGAELYRAANETRVKAESKRIEAPHYLEIDDGVLKNTLLTGGLPFHIRQELTRLDSLLIVRGETARVFRFGLALDLTHPMQEAISFLSPTVSLCEDRPPPASAASSWLFHIDAKNVVATHWQPLVEAGRAIGFRVRLLETEGRPAQVKLSTFRPVAAARKVDFRGTTTGDCTLADGKLQLPMSGNEWVEIEAKW